MLGWWAAFFFAGILAPSRPAGVAWGWAAALLPLLRQAMLRPAPLPLDRRLLLRAVLTVSTGLAVYQYSSLSSPERAAAPRVQQVAAAPESVPAPVSALRSHVRSVCSSRRLDARTRGMLLALLLADRSALDRDVRDQWRWLGIAHFLALSGLHLGIIALPLYRLLSLLRLRGAVREGAALLVLSLYAASAGAPLSLLRAASLLLVLRLHLLAGRRAHRDEALLCGAWIVCLFIPRSTSDPGFLLSVSAAGGVLLVGLPLGLLLRPRGGGRARRWAYSLAAAICVSFSATLFTIPLTTRLFGRAPLSGPLLSVLLAPLVTVFLYAGFSYAAVGHLLGAAGAFPVNCIARALTALPGIVPARFDAAVIEGDMNEPLFASGAALLACALARGRPKRRIAALGAACIAVSFLAGSGPRTRGSPGGCDTLCAGVVMIDHEGTILIEAPLSRGKAALVRRGLLERGIRSVDRVIVAHGGCLSIEGLSVLDEGITLRLVYVSPWLTGCPGASRLTGCGRILPLCGTILLDAGNVKLGVQGPRALPGEAGVFASSDTDLRIYRLDSDDR